jgi:hypothetical protein
MDQSIVLSTDVQNWHDYDAFQPPHSTAQCEGMDMSHYHESCISRFLLLCGLVVGERAACAEVSISASKAKRGPGLHVEPSIHGRKFTPYMT